MNRMAASPLLRRALAIDAATCVAAGFVMAGGAGVLAPALALPVELLRLAGLALLPFAALLAWLARRERVSRALIAAVIAANALWAADSVALLLSGWIAPNGLGLAFVETQAAAVAVLAWLQYLGLRRSGASGLAEATGG